MKNKRNSVSLNACCLPLEQFLTYSGMHHLVDVCKPFPGRDTEEGFTEPSANSDPSPVDVAVPIIKPTAYVVCMFFHTPVRS